MLAGLRCYKHRKDLRCLQIPAIERILARGGRRSPNPDIEVLVISPTRELAQQIEAEAKALLKYHPLRSDIIFGGSNINSDRRRFENQPAEVSAC
jgi:ATP-dependent RNA helicase MSS116